jgi:UDP-N-acetylmuramoylalanine--D-glutamate ligase
MTGFESHFKGKKITVMGLGLLGRGLGDVEFLARCGAELIVTDMKTTEQLASSVAMLSKYPNITFVLGEHRLEDFRDRDMVIKAAGIPHDSIYIAEALKHKIPVRMSTALFASLAPITIVGVTGTRGKTTVTMMLYETLKRAYADTNTTVYLGGNVRGVATLPLLEKVKSGDMAVLELDSWQLQGFHDLGISPQVAVFTTFYPDHLNYYKNDLEHYFSDKAGIFERQTPEDILVLGEQVATVMPAKFKKMIPAHVTTASEKSLPKKWQLKIPGEHNRYNAGVAFATLTAMGIDEEVIQQSLESFGGVEGRLQHIGEHAGVAIYNDNNSTTPDATIVALKALGKPSEKTIVLIMGGADKGIDMDGLLKLLPEYCKKVIVLPGTGTDRIKDQLERCGAPIAFVESLNDAVTTAFAVAEPGDTLLFSPAFASFGLFKNEYDRCDQFVELIKTATKR